MSNLGDLQRYRARCRAIKDMARTVATFHCETEAEDIPDISWQLDTLMTLLGPMTSQEKVDYEESYNKEFDKYTQGK